MFVAASDSMDGSVTVMPSEYQSWTLCAHGRFSIDEFETKIDELIEQREKGALWARIGEDSNHIAAAIASLKPRGFSFHHFARRTNEFVYMLWNNPSVPNKVPPFSTAFEGCSAVVLSPDETEALFVLERGGWKTVSGVVEQGESALEACAREVEEETGVEVEVIRGPGSFVGCYRMTHGRLDGISDVHYCFRARAKARLEYDAAKTDGEISGFRWFSVRTLCEAARSWSAAKDAEAAALAEGGSGTADTEPSGQSIFRQRVSIESLDSERTFSALSLLWLMNVADGKCLRSTRPHYAQFVGADNKPRIFDLFR